MSESFYKPRYTDIESVKMELRGKVSFSEEDDHYMRDGVIYDKIARAEALVELDLSRIYEIPFQGLKGEPFDEIGEKYYSSKMFISTMALFNSCILILDTYYSMADGNTGSDAKQNFVNRLVDYESSVIDREQDIAYYWKHPPLHGLKLNKNASNSKAALIGPMNAVISTNNTEAELVRSKLTNPNRNWFLSYGWRTNCK